MAALTESELHEFMAGPVMDAARRQAGIVADRYAGIEQQDVEQEIWVWFYGDGKRKAQRLVLKGDIAPVEKAFYNAAVDYCERERKASLGYDWRDDYNYSRPEVARLLPLALDRGHHSRAVRRWLA
jgi:hypothetical protein